MASALYKEYKELGSSLVAPEAIEIGELEGQADIAFDKQMAILKTQKAKSLEKINSIFTKTTLSKEEQEKKKRLERLFEAQAVRAQFFEAKALYTD